jgi:hypothetical protein
MTGSDAKILGRPTPLSQVAAKFVFQEPGILDNFLEEPAWQFARVHRNDDGPIRVKAMQDDVAPLLPQEREPCFFPAL